MHKNLVSFLRALLLFVLPILGRAAAMAVADELVKYANAEEPKKDLPKRTPGPADPAFRS